MNDPAQNHLTAGSQSPETAPQQTNALAPDQAKLPRKSNLIGQLAIGFLGWYVVMALIYGLLFRSYGTGSADYDLMALGCYFLPLQVLILIFLLANRKLRRIGWGMLSAIGLNLMISLVLGLFGNALCFIPFFKPMN
jgi:hypothetical protein